MKNKIKGFICDAVMLLEYIPSYRRYYKLDQETKQVKGPFWSYRPPGIGGWGLDVLVALNLCDWYFQVHARYVCARHGTVTRGDLSCPTCVAEGVFDD